MVYTQLINNNQVGYVENQNIKGNIRTVIDLLHYTKVTNIPGLLIFIDFKKRLIH